MKTQITKVYGPEFPVLVLAEADNKVLAQVINALEETDRDLKQIGKMGRAKMLARIEKRAQELDLDLSQEAYLHHIYVMGSFADWLKVATAPVVKEKAPKKPKAPKVDKGPSIRSVAEAILLKVAHTDEDGRPFGLSYEEVLAEVKEQFPEAKTTVACLRWYAAHMREREVKVPARPRANTTKNETEGE